MRTSSRRGKRLAPLPGVSIPLNEFDDKEEYKQQMEVARKLGDAGSEAMGAWNLGLCRQKLGDPHGAVTCMQLRVDHERQIGHPDTEAHAEELDRLRTKLNQ